MLSLAGQGRNAHLFDAHEDIDDGTLSNIWVANCTNDKPLVIFGLFLGPGLFLEPSEELGSRENFARAKFKLLI